jgi:rhodanese-related sulfurtransferase
MVNWRRFLIEAGTLVFSAAFCAVLANQFAGRERKLNLPGGDPRPTVERAAVRPPAATSPATQIPTSATATTTEPEPAVQTPSVEPKPAAKPAVEPVKPSPQPPAQAARQFLPLPDKPWVEIDPAAVRELYARGVPFIDARRTNVFEQGHIAGARSMPVWESDLNDRLKAFYEEGLDPEAPVVIYCSGGNCEDSHMLGERLWGIGFNNVLVYKDGYPDWVKNGGRIETGPATR